MARDFLQRLVLEGRIGKRERPAPFEQVRGKILTVRGAVGGDGAVVVPVAPFAANETLDLEIERERCTAAARHRAFEVAAGLRRGRNENTMQPVGMSLDPQRAIVVHEGVARNLSERRCA